MSSAPKPPSPELLKWISDHKIDVRSKLTHAPLNFKNRQDFATKVIENHHVLHEAWASVVELVKHAKAPLELQKEAEQVNDQLNSAHDHHSTSNEEKAQLIALAPDILKLLGPKELPALLKDAVAKGRLSKPLSDRMTTFMGTDSSSPTHGGGTPLSLLGCAIGIVMGLECGPLAWVCSTIGCALGAAV